MPPSPNDTNQDFRLSDDFSGSLSELSVFDLYRHLYLARRTGTLVLQRDEVIKQIVFSHGSIVFTITNQDSERLGAILVNKGKISETQKEEIIRESLSGRRFGQIVVAHGILSEKELDSYVRFHQSQVAISTLEWDSGSYSFRSGERPEYRDVYVELSTANIIFEGVRRIGDVQAIKKLIGSQDARLCLASDPLLRFQKISLDPQEAYVFSRVEGVMSAAEICQVSALDETSTLRALLGLVLTGILEYSDAGAARVAEAARPDVSPRVYYARPVLGIDVRMAEEIRTLHDKFKSSTLYEILGVSQTATKEELERAYFELARRFHPDQFSHSAQEDIREMGEKVFRSIGDAYNILKDDTQRAGYDERLRVQQRESDAQVSDSRIRASLHAIGRKAFDEGKRLCKSGEYSAALERFRDAVRIDESMAPYRYHLALTLARFPERRREAEFHFQLAIQQAPWNAEYHLGLGRLYEELGLQSRAKTYFDKAAELERKQQKDEQRPDSVKKGVFSRFFDTK